MIDQRQERQRTAEVQIMQKVNHAYLDAFHQKFPGAIEHNMRLINERLQHCLNKAEGTVLNKPETWPAQPAEISELCHALWHLEQVRQHWPTQE